MQHVVMFSAGAGSWAAARRVAEQFGSNSLRLLFTDTLTEDADAYRFLIEGAANVLNRDLSKRMTTPSLSEFPDFRDRASWRHFLNELRAETAIHLPELVWLVDGRDVWEVFRDERFLGNSRADPCSKILKRQKADQWLVQNCDAQLRADANGAKLFREQLAKISDPYERHDHWLQNAWR